MSQKLWYRVGAPLALGAFLLAGIPQQAPAADKDDKSAAKDDDRDFDVVFLKDAAERIAGEMEINQMVDEHTKTEGVIHYAHLQITSYRPILNAVQALAQERHVKVPTGLGEKQKDAKAKLSKLKNDEFDLQYASNQMDEQESIVNLFERGSKDLKDKKLREFASANVKDLRERLAVAKDLYRDVKKDNK